MVHYTKFRHFVAAMMACLFVSLAHADVAPKRNVQIAVSRSQTEAENIAWTAYGVSLASYLQTSRSVNTVPDGEYIPTFQAEVSARTKLLRIWRELIEKQTLQFPYMDTLIKVENSGFLHEYIWLFHHRAAWKDEDAPPNQKAFALWAKENLSNHVPMTGTKLVVSTSK